MTRDESGNTLIYDAWGRLVKVQSSGGSPISTYEHDALSRRIEANGSQLIYSAGWHVVEERSASTGTKQAQYLWSPVYVDAMVLRDRDTDGNGSLDQRTASTTTKMTATLRAPATAGKRPDDSKAAQGQLLRQVRERPAAD